MRKIRIFIALLSVLSLSLFVSCDKEGDPSVLLECDIEYVGATSATVSFTAKTPSNRSGQYVGVCIAVDDPMAHDIKSYRGFFSGLDYCGIIEPAESGKRKYTFVVDGLNPESSYNVRAFVYAESDGLTTWGKVSSFTTDLIIGIPDSVFKSYLIRNFDINGDGEISVLEALQVKSIECTSLKIKSLDGIQYFGNLEELYCHVNSLTSLDLSNNTALEHLDCSGNRLTDLDVSKCTSLVDLVCFSNNLTSLDISRNLALEHLGCDTNLLTDLDVSKCTSLVELGCSYNKLTSLDISRNLALERLNCSANHLTDLDVSKCPSLYILRCGRNNLTSLDVSKCTTSLVELYCADNSLNSLVIGGNSALTALYCWNNNLTSIDVSKCMSLRTLYCQENSLTSLDVSNNLSLRNLFCNGNPSLKEIWLRVGQTIDVFDYSEVATIRYK